MRSEVRPVVIVVLHLGLEFFSLCNKKIIKLTLNAFWFWSTKLSIKFSIGDGHTYPSSGSLVFSGTWSGPKNLQKLLQIIFGSPPKSMIPNEIEVSFHLGGRWCLNLSENLASRQWNSLLIYKPNQKYNKT